jgi:LysM repeat protein
MRRSYQWTWVGLLAAALAPGVALAQAAAPATHTVRSGDTLWDLARQYRGDPFLWPDIYRMNTSVVEDPHWIYPGEVLRLAGADTVPSVPTTDTPEPPAQVATAAGTDSTAGADTAAVAPQKTLAQLTAVSATEPGTDDQGLFGPRRSRMMEQTLKAYTEQPYRALRPSEFYSSGFLTENDRLPFGKVLGPVIPEQIRSSSAQATALPLTAIAVEAPRGGSYQIGDTLLVLQLGPEIRSYGDVVVPTGLARVVDTVQGRFVAELVATYGPVRQGQRVLPAEKFTPSGDAHAVPVNDGVQATFIGGAGRQDLKAPQMVVVLDKGRRDGVAPGDLFEIRRHPERLPDGRQLVNDVMATVQVVHVREHTATGRVLNVLSPDIAPGTEARQIARLPS